MMVETNRWKDRRADRGSNGRRAWTEDEHNQVPGSRGSDDVVLGRGCLRFGLPGFHQWIRFDGGKVRRDITEGKPGTPLLVTLHLVEAGSCAPIRDAVVDIWHTDAAGRYSGFRGQDGDGVDTLGETFLRGTQITDADGLAEFETIYPGWYPGRTVHIHFKVYTSERTLVTSQMYFPDDVTDAVYLSEPYSARGPRRTTNESDRLPNDDSEYRTLLGQVTQDGDGFLVSLTIGVVR